MCLVSKLEDIDGVHLQDNVQWVSKPFLVRLDIYFLQWVVSGIYRRFCLIRENG